MRTIKFYVDKVLPKIKLYIEDVSPRIKFYVDKPASKIKFYTDKNTSQIRFYVDSVPARIRFYIESFMSTVLVAFKHVDIADVSVLARLKILAKGVMRTADRAIVGLSLYFALRGFVHQENNIAFTKAFLKMKAASVAQNIEKHVVNLITIFRVASKHVDTFVANVRAVLLVRTSAVSKTVCRAVVELSMRVGFFITHKESNKGNVRGFLKQWTSGAIRTQDNLSINPITTLFAKASHVDVSEHAVNLSILTHATLADINDFTLADINNKTINEIIYKEVL